MKKVEILICSEQGFRATRGAGRWGLTSMDFYGGTKKREKGSKNSHIQ